MRRRQRQPWLLVLPLVLLTSSVLAQQPTPSLPVDEASGLVIDEHWQLVKAHCTVCHSVKLVTQQRASRDTWLYLIRWMQQTQGLWQFDAVTESSILDYLEKNYAPSASSRRAPLTPELLPPSVVAPAAESPLS